MALPEYRKLNADELEMADHYAETGNFSGLRRMQAISASREPGGQRIRSQDTDDVDMSIMPTRRLY